MSRKMGGLCALFLVALALRVALTVALSIRHDAPVTYEHGEIARNLLAGRGFSVKFLGAEGPTSQQAPLYPALLAVSFCCFGVDSQAAVVAVQLAQCLAGAAIVLAVVWLTWSLVPSQPVCGWVAGCGAAVYPAHVYMVTHIQVAVWAALALTVLCALTVSPRWTGTWRKAAAIGALSGLVLLIDPILVVALPVLAAAFWLYDFNSRDRTNAGLLAAWLPTCRAAFIALVTLVVVAPWLWRNRQVHGEFVFIKSTFGYALWQGNNPLTWGTDKIPKASVERIRRRHDGSLAGVERALWEARHETLYIDDVLLKPGGYREFAGLSEPARSRLLGQRAWTFIRSEPRRYLALCVQRLRYFLLFDETNPKTANPVYRISTAAWLLLAATGLLLGARHFRTLWPSVAIFAAVAAFHTLTIVSARFRIPVEPLTFAWAALTVTFATNLARRSIAALLPSRPVTAPETAGSPDCLAPRRFHKRANTARLR